ncbi:hypothetical protein WM40_11935 [Robbsia andropogonis]|uniref:Peptidase M20 dimerisation domain-containing protein n=1 Tax=Robbsia andropogonis TaxID=28092 RepID=A0A0F5K1K5_9BURK|nr:M20 family metallopeptidase [Robbsia andropogonis]KKB63432.1 hypothetical protein WM40_11935 [Robbsia andropogonis]MCP1120397.1 M20 family metallopeptidase [Robbsia andropogonis]MCP1130249.1 M20 family metallopeptidase [Robbsia andropogonis]
MSLHNSRANAIERVSAYFDDGRFYASLQRRVAVKTESQDSESLSILLGYLREQLAPALEALGFTWTVLENPIAGKSPFLIAERIEPGATYTVLTYGHGDVVRGYDAQWRTGLSPWKIVVEGDKWYGRGTADNKGQHTINLVALAEVIAERGGVLGYNVKAIFEMGEEIGSPGLGEICAANKQVLAADLFLASDGPRLNATRPTLFLGSRGNFNFEMRLELRDGAHHSGNWGGLLRSPGIRLANALASMVSPTGKILVEKLRPSGLPQSVRDALKDIHVGGGPTDPEIDPQWGEPGLTPEEKVFGWNSFDIMAFKTGNPEAPANAISGYAYAHCQVRYVVGSDGSQFLQYIRDHLDSLGYSDIELKITSTMMPATRLDPTDPWVNWGLTSIAKTTGKKPALLPNLGGSLPNEVFSDILGLPTLWVPHSYPACSQHAPDEHILASTTRESLQVMAGLFWDLAEQGASVVASRNAGLSAG